MAQPTPSDSDPPNEAVNETIGDDSQPRDTEPEEGGFKGWLQVAGCFALYYNHL